VTRVALFLVAGAIALGAAAPAQAARAPCTITGTAGADALRGSSGADVICGRGGDDRIYGFQGDDVLRGGPGDDTLAGGSGDDRLNGGDGEDLLYDDEGDDVLAAGGEPGDRAATLRDEHVEVPVLALGASKQQFQAGPLNRCIGDQRAQDALGKVVLSATIHVTGDCYFSGATAMWTYIDPAMGLLAWVGFDGRDDTGWPPRCFAAIRAGCSVQAGAILIAPLPVDGGDAAADPDDPVLPVR
jgi:hypothetical protein